MSLFNKKIKRLNKPSSSASMEAVYLMVGIMGLGFLALLITFTAMLMKDAGELVVTFNQPVLTKRFVTQLSQHEISDEALRAKTDAFRDALHLSVEAYAEEHDVLVLDVNHVMAGERDVTEAIGAMVATRMRGASQ